MQTCFDNNGNVLYKACTSDTVALKRSEMCEASYRDSGFIDDRSICSNNKNKINIKQAICQDIEANNSQIEYSREKSILKKNSQGYDDSGIDKESSSSDIDEIARFNQIELRKQALKSRKKSFNNEHNSAPMNTIPKPKSKLSQSNADIQLLDPRNLSNENKHERSANQMQNDQLSCEGPKDIYKISPMLNSCGLIMCSNLPTPVFTSFIPANLIPITFKDNNNNNMFIQTVTNGIMQSTENLSTNEALQKGIGNNVTKSVKFAPNSDNSEELQHKKFAKNIKKSTTFQDRTRAQLEEATFAWQRRQAAKRELESEPMPPVFESLNSPAKEDDAYFCENENSNSNGSEINSDEFQFFMNAIEKLKAANLFHEDDLKKMTDEQIYEALIEHARMQKKATYPVVNENFCRSIDKEEEDLPIIMRNLHSVKSLKHYFEIKSKTSDMQSTSHSPLVVSKSARQAISCQIRSNEKSVEKNFQTEISLSTSPLSIKEEEEDGGESEGTSEILNAKSIEVSESISVTREASVQTDSNSNQDTCVERPPLAPPPPKLPEYLFKSISSEMLKESKSLLKHSASYKKRKGSLEVQQSCSSPTPYSEHRDLHEKLIKEIHNKSMERSRKETNICLDERGNLVQKPVGRVYTSVKNHKLYRIKDNSSISSVEIKEFSRIDNFKNNMSKSFDGVLRTQLDSSHSLISLEERKESPEPTKIEVTSKNDTEKQSLQSINIKTASNELVKSMASGTNLSENSETNEPIDIVQSFITQNSNSSVDIKLNDKVSSKPPIYKGDANNERRRQEASVVIKPVVIPVKPDDENENDQLSELISISQVPSVFPSLDRKDTIYKSSSFRTGNMEINSLESVQELRRTVSFKSDLSIDTASLKSTRSMLSEAKAKLEILSAKISKGGENEVQKPSSKILSKKSFSKLNNFNSNSNNSQISSSSNTKNTESIDFDQITKF